MLALKSLQVYQKNPGVQTKLLRMLAILDGKRQEVGR